MMPLTGTSKANRTLLYSIQQEVSCFLLTEPVHQVSLAHRDNGDVHPLVYLLYLIVSSLCGIGENPQFSFDFNTIIHSLLTTP